jgi:hypothetical protein
MNFRIVLKNAVHEKVPFSFGHEDESLCILESHQKSFRVFFAKGHVLVSVHGRKETMRREQNTIQIKEDDMLPRLVEESILGKRNVKIVPANDGIGKKVESQVGFPWFSIQEFCLSRGQVHMSEHEIFGKNCDMKMVDIGLIDERHPSVLRSSKIRS